MAELEYPQTHPSVALLKNASKLKKMARELRAKVSVQERHFLGNCRQDDRFLRKAEQCLVVVGRELGLTPETLFDQERPPEQLPALASPELVSSAVQKALGLSQTAPGKESLHSHRDVSNFADESPKSNSPRHNPAGEDGGPRKKEVPPMACACAHTILAFGMDCVRLCWESVEDDKGKLIRLEEDNQRLEWAIRGAQRAYLQEVTNLRDKLRADNPIFFDQDERYFYEPIQFLDHELQELVREICIEKVKLELARFHGGGVFLKEIERLKEEMEALKADYEQKIADLEKALELQRQNNAEQAKQLAQCQKDKEKLQQDFEKANKQIEELNKQISELRNEISRLNRALESKGEAPRPSQIDSSAAEAARREQELRDELAALRMRIQDLEKELALAKRPPEVKEVKPVIDTSGNKDLEKLRLQMQKEIDELKKQLEDALKANEDLRNQMENSGDQAKLLADLRRQLAAMEKRAMDAEARALAAEQTIESLRNASGGPDADEIERRIREEYEAKMKLLKAEQQKAISQLKMELAEAKKRIAELEAENRALKKEVELLRKKFADLQEMLKKQGLGDLCDELMADLGLSDFLAGAPLGNIFDRLYADAQERRLRAMNRSRRHFYSPDFTGMQDYNKIGMNISGIPNPAVTEALQRFFQVQMEAATGQDAQMPELAEQVRKVFGVDLASFANPMNYHHQLPSTHASDQTRTQAAKKEEKSYTYKHVKDSSAFEPRSPPPAAATPTPKKSKSKHHRSRSPTTASGSDTELSGNDNLDPEKAAYPAAAKLVKRLSSQNLGESDKEGPSETPTAQTSDAEGTMPGKESRGLKGTPVKLKSKSFGSGFDSPSASPRQQQPTPTAANTDSSQRRQQPTPAAAPPRRGGPPPTPDSQRESSSAASAATSDDAPQRQLVPMEVPFDGFPQGMQRHDPVPSGKRQLHQKFSPPWQSKPDQPMLPTEAIRPRTLTSSSSGYSTGREKPWLQVTPPPGVPRSRSNSPMQSPKALSPLGEAPFEEAEWMPLSGAGQTAPSQWRPQQFTEVAPRRPAAKQTRHLKPQDATAKPGAQSSASEICVDNRFRAGTAPPKDDYAYASASQKDSRTPMQAPTKKGGGLSPLMGDTARKGLGSSMQTSPPRNSPQSALLSRSQPLLKSQSLPHLNKSNSSDPGGSSASRGRQPQPRNRVMTKLSPRKESPSSPRGALPPVDGAANLQLLRTAEDLDHVGVDSHTQDFSSSGTHGRTQDMMALRNMVSAPERLNEIRKLEQYPRMPRRGGSIAALCEGFSDQL